MSLKVSDDLLAIAERGDTDAEFVACVRESLPYAWEVISTVMTDLRTGDTDFAGHETPPLSEVETDWCRLRVWSARQLFRPPAGEIEEHPSTVPLAGQPV
jgi:uncharacterized protein